MSSIPTLQNYVATRKAGAPRAGAQQRPAGLAAPETKVLQEAKTKELTEGAKQAKLLQQYKAEGQQRQAKQQVQQAKQVRQAQQQQAKQAKAAQKAGEERQQKEERQAKGVTGFLSGGHGIGRYLKPIKNGLKAIPDLGSPLLPLTILFLILFVLVPYGPDKKTRLQLLFSVLVGDSYVSLPNSSIIGGSIFNFLKQAGF